MTILSILFAILVAAATLAFIFKLIEIIIKEINWFLEVMIRFVLLFTRLTKNSRLRPALIKSQYVENARYRSLLVTTRN